jgi:Family of unknown function (DUF5755)
MVVKKRATRGIVRMLGGAAASVCPPGVLCMDTGFTVVCVLLFAVLGFLLYKIYSREMKSVATPAPTIVVIPNTGSNDTATPPPPMDPRFAPLSPERTYDTPPDLRGFPSPPISAGIGVSSGGTPINQPTRGVPESYQQVGILTAPGGSDTSASPSRTILPLFGRKLITNRDRWNYYTRTDGLNPVQVPVEYKRRKCDDDNGCDEVMDGESVSVPVLGQSYVATVYRYSTPRYIPYV